MSKGGSDDRAMTKLVIKSRDKWLCSRRLEKSRDV